VKKLKRISASEAVVNHFRGLLQVGDLQPGDELPSERALTEELGISRFSLREGLARLNALGIIDVHHGKGAVVCRNVEPSILNDVFLPFLSNPETQSVADLIEARIVLEKAMFAKAAEVRSDEDVEKLREIVVETVENFEDIESFARLDYLFHQEVARIAGNRILGAMQEMLHTNIQDFIFKSVQDKSVRKKAKEDHCRLFECIKNRYTQQVVSVIEEHIRTCRIHYEKRFLTRDHGREPGTRELRK
jgi:DNA-binding FadR family transcriptional regulator